MTQTEPVALDAVAAAPRFHRLLLENEYVRVLDTMVPPGETVPLHTHCWPGVLYIISWSHCLRRDARGCITMDSRNSSPPPPGTTLWSEPLEPHTLENIGDGELRVIAVEHKQPHTSQQ